MPSLFVVMLGGRHARANTEVHDVVLAIGETLQEVYPQLKQAWFGEAEGLHIDAWAQIDRVHCDGKNYRLAFKSVAAAQDMQKLYLINLGGYDPQAFGELHRYVLVVAEHEADAKAKGKQHVAAHWHKPHRDRVLDVDDCLQVHAVHGQYVHLLEVESEAYLEQDLRADFVQNYWENTYLHI